MSNLNLGVIGNCSFGALVDSVGDIVWCCLPRFDGDPIFCRLLNDGDLRRTLSRAAASRVREQFDVPRAAAEINRTLQTVSMAFRRR